MRNVTSNLLDYAFIFVSETILSCQCSPPESGGGRGVAELPPGIRHLLKNLYLILLHPSSYFVSKIPWGLQIFNFCS